MVEPLAGRGGTSAEAGDDIHDRVLMARIAAGDEESFAALVHRYWRRLAAFSERFVGAREAGEDVAQEVFIRVWEHRDEWRPVGSVRAYLYRIARNLAVDEQRKRQTRGRSLPELRSLQPRPQLPIRSAEQRELRDALRAAVDDLPPRRREVFLLVHVEGLSYREVGEILQIAVPTVANQLSAALAELRSALRSHLPATP